MENIQNSTGLQTNPSGFAGDKLQYYMDQLQSSGIVDRVKKMQQYNN